jgi:hypothetical protein
MEILKVLLSSNPRDVIKFNLTTSMIKFSALLLAAWSQ